MALPRLTLIGFVLLFVLLAYRASRPAERPAPRSPADATALSGRRPLPLTAPLPLVAHIASGGQASVESLSLAPQPGPEQPTAAAPRPAAAALVGQPLPNCSVVFFHHLEKTGGTTLRSILQRHAQLGEFDFVSFVNRFDKLQLQMVLHRLHTLLDEPGGLANLRLAVEIHIGGHLRHPYFTAYTLPDLLLLRSLLRARGCRCHLVTLLRHPLLHHLSWHYHFCNHRVPLCFWRNPPDCQTRLALGLTCHDGPHLDALTEEHERSVSFMWGAFDLVGVTELFDEFVLRLTDLVGLQRPAYRSQIVASHTLSRQQAQRNWTALTCAQLLVKQPSDLMGLIAARMAGSAKNAANHRRNNGGSSTGGPRGHMECRGYGPCLVPGKPENMRSVDMVYEEASCAPVTPLDVLRRACGGMGVDERTYRHARHTFEASLQKAGSESGNGAHFVPITEARVALLRAAGVALNARADQQRETSVRTLEQLSGSHLEHKYTSSSGGGVPWVVDEHHNWYLPHERARFSCERCSGDVVPEKDLLGCWPLWPQFAPDEIVYRCNRTWTADPGLHEPRRFKKRDGGNTPMPCWRTCWTPVALRPHAPVAGTLPLPRGADYRPHCTAACRTETRPAWQWRAAWEAQLRGFVEGHPEGREWRSTMQFVTPFPKDDFIWNVY